MKQRSEHSVNRARTLKWMCLLKSKEATKESQNRRNKLFFLKYRLK